MSMFLGPIHYWLYNKIGKQEELTALLAEDAEKKGWIEEAQPYTKNLPPLERVIDESNIHGWLQEQIADGEKRYADLITRLLGEDPARMEDLEDLAFAFGKENGPEDKPDLQGFYQYFEDFFVNGMPCDRVNRLTDRGEDKLAWLMVEDIHGKYWPGGETENYYKLRKAVMDGLVDGSGIQVTMQDPFHYLLEVEK